MGGKWRGGGQWGQWATASPGVCRLQAKHSMRPLRIGPLTPLELQILGCSYLVDENANRIPAGRNKVSSHSIAAVYHYVTKSHEVRARMHVQLALVPIAPTEGLCNLESSSVSGYPSALTKPQTL